MNDPIYVIITPSRNEEKHLPKTIDSMAAQTIRPRKWILVDDGSTDGSPALLDNAAKVHPWMQIVHRPDRGFRKAGGGVIEAFYDGYKLLEGTAWDYIVKLDGDLSFGPGYFAGCLEHFRTDPKLGIGGGTVCSAASNGVESEAHGDPPFHVRGAVKMYRRACWEGIGGLHKTTGWDTLDELKANMLGWTSYTFADLKLTHHRFAGEADGAWKNWVKNGRANYITGYHPLFMLLKCISRVREKPFVVAAAGLGVGFLGGYFKNEPQIGDRELIKYVRHQQMRRLTMRESLWSKAVLK